MKTLRERLKEDSIRIANIRISGVEIPQTDIDEMEQQSCNEFMKECLDPLSDAVNFMSGPTLGLAAIEWMNCEHRTLQQSFFSQIIMPLIINWANNYTARGGHDGRNEDTCKLCAEIAVLLEKHYFARKEGDKYIPLTMTFI